MSFDPIGGAAPLIVFDDGSGPALYGYLYRWNGSSWIPLPPIPGLPSSPTVYAVTVYDDGTGPGLYAAGFFTGGGINNIARWNGQSWSNVGGGVTLVNPEHSAYIATLAVYDDDGPGPRRPGLYAAGNFSSAGGVAASNIARWDGASWEPLAGGVNTNVFPFVPNIFCMADFQGELYVSGNWNNVDGMMVSGIARWNGARWADVGGGFDPGGGVAHAMAVFDDGAGPALFAGGNIVTAGGLPVHKVARWNGAAWSAVGSGFTGVADDFRAMAVYDGGSGPGLYVGGRFSTAGGVPASNIARWGLPECPANCDGSRNASNCATLDVSDFLCFLGRFAAHDQRANCDASSTGPVLNVNDFVCFQSKFAAGCP